MTSATGRSRLGANRGYTLLELCLVGVIIGLIASLGWPTLKSFAGSIEARTRAAQLARRFHSARERAIRLGRSQSVNVIQDGATYESGPAAEFYSDGTAQFFKAEWPTVNERRITVQVEESGEIVVHES